MAFDDLIGTWIFLLNIQHSIKAGEDCITQGLLKLLHQQELINRTDYV